MSVPPLWVLSDGVKYKNTRSYQLWNLKAPAGECTGIHSQREEAQEENQWSRCVAKYRGCDFPEADSVSV